MINIAKSIVNIYPDLRSLIDFVVIDNMDGQGQVLKEWNSNYPQPTQEQLESSWLQVVKNEKIEELRENCNDTILSGYTSNALGEPHQYGFSYEDQINLAGAKQIFDLNPALPSISWKTLDAGPLPHTRDQFLSMWLDGFNHKNNNIQKYWVKKGQVNSCNSEDEVNAVNWE